MTLLFREVYHKRLHDGLVIRRCYTIFGTNYIYIYIYMIVAALDLCCYYAYHLQLFLVTKV